MHRYCEAKRSSALLSSPQSRAKVTGRMVPRDLLERTMLEVPVSISLLAPKVDFTVELRNAPDSTDIEIATPCVTWASFKKVWKQNCVRSSKDKVSLVDCMGES
jgi:hypothetical protein